MTSDLDIYRSASVIISQHGEDAALEAGIRGPGILEAVRPGAGARRGRDPGGWGFGDWDPAGWDSEAGILWGAGTQDRWRLGGRGAGALEAGILGG